MDDAGPLSGGWRHDLGRAAGELKEFSRRGFFTLVGLVGLAVATISALVLSLRFLAPPLPAVTPRLFVVGRADDFPVGSTTAFVGERVALNRDVDGFYAVSMICAHMECTVAWFADDQVFRCPCHGGRFLRDGTRFYGPPPGPLKHLAVVARGDGTLVVNLDEVVGAETRLVA